MKIKKITLLLLTLMVLFLSIGWIIRQNLSPSSIKPEVQTESSFSPPASLPMKPSPPLNQPAAENHQAPTQPSAEPVQGQLGHISGDLLHTTVNNDTALSSVNYSIKKEKKREILPGVTVDKGTVTIRLDKDSEKNLEIQKNASPTSEYQVMWQTKY